MVENLKIALFGNFMVIGKFENGLMYEPRTVHAVINRFGEATVTLNFLIGKPDSITLHNAQASYDVMDDTMMNLYVEATTGLRIPG